MSILVNKNTKVFVKVLPVNKVHFIHEQALHTVQKW